MGAWVKRISILSVMCATVWGGAGAYAVYAKSVECQSVGKNNSATGRGDREGAVANLPPEVRLRKMHLARPDLIPYPIDIEVYC